MAVFSLFQKTLNAEVSLVEISNAMANATISLFGGQVLHFRPKHDNRERLFVSPSAVYDGSKSIRGGVPLCWPWFGSPPREANLPAHGYVRTRRWLLLSTENSLQCTRLVLTPETLAHPAQPEGLALELEILIGEKLEISLRTTNRGKEDQPLNCALHSYFAVSDIAQVRLDGLEGMYSDKTRDWNRFDTPAPYAIEGETDRIHLQSAKTVLLHDPQGDVRINSQGHDSIVVWNPGPGAEKRFADLSPDDYRHMLCVETALTQPFILAPDQSHTLTQIID